MIQQGRNHEKVLGEAKPMVGHNQLFFSITITIFSHSRSDQFLKQNTICLFESEIVLWKILFRNDPNLQKRKGKFDFICSKIV